VLVSDAAKLAEGNDTVYIQGLTPEVTAEKLAEFFGSIGILKVGAAALIRSSCIQSPSGVTLTLSNLYAYALPDATRQAHSRKGAQDMGLHRQDYRQTKRRRHCILRRCSVRSGRCEVVQW